MLHDVLLTDVKTKVELDTAGVIAPTQRMGTAFDRTTKKMNEVVKGTHHLKQNMGYLHLALTRIATYTAIFTFFGGLAKLIGEVFTLESALIEVSTLVNLRNQDVARSFYEVTESLLKLDPYLGTSINLTKGLYEIMSAGVTKPREAFKLLVISAKYAKAGLTDLATAASTLTSVMKAYGYTAEEMRGKSDMLFASVMEGKYHADELNDAIGKILPTAATMGIGIDQISAALAVMTQRGLDVKSAATALNRMLISFLRPIDQAKEWFRKLGWQWGRNAFQSVTLLGAMQRLESASKRYGDILPQIFRRQRALRGAFILTGTGLQDFERLLKKIQKSTEEGGEVSRAYQKVIKSVQEELKATHAAFLQATQGILKHTGSVASLITTVRAFGVELLTNYERLLMMIGVFFAIKRAAISATVGLSLYSKGVIAVAVVHKFGIVASLRYVKSLFLVKVTAQSVGKALIAVAKYWYIFVGAYMAASAIIKAVTKKLDEQISAIVSLNKEMTAARTVVKHLVDVYRELHGVTVNWRKEIRELEYKHILLEIGEMIRSSKNLRQVTEQLLKVTGNYTRKGIAKYAQGFSNMIKAIVEGTFKTEDYRRELLLLRTAFNFAGKAHLEYTDILLKDEKLSKRITEERRESLLALRDFKDVVRALKMPYTEMIEAFNLEQLRDMTKVLRNFLSSKLPEHVSGAIREYLKGLGIDLEALRKELKFTLPELEKALGLKPEADITQRIREHYNILIAKMKEVAPPARDIMELARGLQKTWIESHRDMGASAELFGKTMKTTLQHLLDNIDKIKDVKLREWVLAWKKYMGKTVDTVSKTAKELIKITEWQNKGIRGLLSDIAQFENELRKEKWNDVVIKTQEENATYKEGLDKRYAWLVEHHILSISDSFKYFIQLALMRKKDEQAQQIANSRALDDFLKLKKDILKGEYDSAHQRVVVARMMSKEFEQFIKGIGVVNKVEIERIRKLWDVFWGKYIQDLERADKPLDRWVTGLGLAARMLSTLKRLLKDFGEALNIQSRGFLKVLDIITTLVAGIRAASAALKAFQAASEAAAKEGAGFAEKLAKIATLADLIVSVATTVVSVLIKLFQGEAAAEKAAKRLAKQMRVLQVDFWKFGSLTDDLAKKFVELKNKVGFTVAMLRMLGDVMRDTGIDAKNLVAYGDQLLSNLRKMAVEEFRTTKNMEGLVDAFSEYMAALKRLGREGSAEIIKFFQKYREMGLVIAEVNEYVFGELDKIPDALKTLVENVRDLKFIPENAIAQLEQWVGDYEKNIKKIEGLLGEELLNKFKKWMKEYNAGWRDLADWARQYNVDLGAFVEGIKKRLDSLSEVTMTTFNAMVASGRSFYESLLALKEPLQLLQERYKAIGAEVPETIRHLLKLAEVMELKPQIFANLDAALTILRSLRNVGFMTQETFSTLAASVAAFAKEVLGVSGNLDKGLKAMGKMTREQIDMILPMVVEFAQVAALFGLKVPSWMKTFIGKIPGLNWEDFQKKVSEQALAGVNTVDRLDKVLKEAFPHQNKTLRAKMFDEGVATRDKLEHLRRDFVDAVGGFAGGSSNVPRTQLATIHKGESILPENLSSVLRDFFTGRRLPSVGGEGGLLRVNVEVDGRLLYSALRPYIREGGRFGDYEVSGEGVF